MFPASATGGRADRALEHLGDPGRRRRLSVGAGHGDPAVRARAPRPRRCARRSRSRRGPAFPATRAAATAGESRGTPGEIASQSAPASSSDGEPPKKKRAPRAAGGLLDVLRQSSSAGRASPTETSTPRASSALGQRPAAAGETEDGDRAAAGSREARSEESPVIGSALIAASGSRGPATAKRIARIQNRMMTRDSAQPSSSK